MDLEKIGSFILKMIGLLRPKFYNRLCWVVVSAGLAMMSSPLIERLISTVIKANFQIDLTNGNDVAWGFGLVVSGLIYHLLTTSIVELASRQKREELDKEKVEHDKKIYEKANEIMGAEFLLDRLDVMWGDHSYYMNDIRKMEAFHRHLAKDENQFLVSGVQESVSGYLNASKNLIEYVSVRFFVYPGSQTGDNLRLCMQPGWNVDREGHGTPEQMEQYDKLAVELHEHIETLISEYKSMRAEIKKKLII